MCTTCAARMEPTGSLRIAKLRESRGDPLESRSRRSERIVNCSKPRALCRYLCRAQNYRGRSRHQRGPSLSVDRVPQFSRTSFVEHRHPSRDDGREVYAALRGGGMLRARWRDKGCDSEGRFWSTAAPARRCAAAQLPEIPELDGQSRQVPTSWQGRMEGVKSRGRRRHLEKRRLKLRCIRLLTVRRCARGAAPSLERSVAASRLAR